MDDATQGAAFLVARGRRRGHRTVLAPRSLVLAGLHTTLMDAVGLSGADSPRPQRVELRAGEIGRITVIWLAETLTRAELDGGRPDGGEPVTDEQGRPLRMVYGIVAKGRLIGAVSDDDLQSARKQAVTSFRRFLLDESEFDVDPSDEFALHGVSVVADEPLVVQPRPAQTPQASARRPARGWRKPSPTILATIVVALGLIVLGVVLLLLDDDAKPGPRAPAIVASTSWTGAFARAAGATSIELIVPAGDADPADADPKLSALAVARGADVVVYSRSDRFAARLTRAASGAVLVPVELENSPKAVHAGVMRLARALGTETRARSWLKRFDTTYKRLSDGLKAKQRTARVRVVSHRSVLPWTVFAGVRVVGTYGPSALTPPQIARIAAAKPALAFDDAASPIGRAVGSSRLAVVTLSNVPDGALDLVKLFRRNAEKISSAFTR